MTRRVVRLLVLLGAMVAAYLVLSLFDHAARADAGSISGETDPVASVKIVAAGTRPAISVPNSTAPQAAAHPQSIRRPAIKVAEVRPPKIPAPKIPAKAKIKAPYVQGRQTVRQAQARTSKVRQSTSAAVQTVARATVTPARKAVVRQILSATAQVASRPELPALPQVEISALPELPSLAKPSAWPRLPTLPQAELAAWPQLSTWPQLPSLPQAPKPVLTQTPTSAGVPVLHQPLVPPVSVQLYPLPRASAFAAASGLSGVTRPPTAQAQPVTMPLPATPRQPTDFSTSTGQASESGGGSAPAMGTVSSSWRPELTAAGRRLATELIARGRTIRYAGPPS